MTELERFSVPQHLSRRCVWMDNASQQDDLFLRWTVNPPLIVSKLESRE